MTSPTDYFADVSKTDMMRVLVALATEVYETRDRLSALESVLSKNGIDLATLDAPAEPAAYDEQKKAIRDTFIANVFSSMSR
ncbi:MAG: hypothetical protein ACI9UN_000947 [Granulosicoccus sp.]|jgi:hypothetical protein